MQDEIIIGGSLKGLLAYKASKPVNTVFKLVTEMFKPVPRKRFHTLNV
jgi:hypothetical protein